MKTLELKHVTPYLPYGLQYLNTLRNEIEFLTVYAYVNYTSLFNKLSYKPILRPISDLTKEIEIEGKKFVPMVELAKIFSKEIYNLTDYELKIKIYEDSINANFHFDYHQPHRKFIYCFLQDIFLNEYKIIQKVFEWHFDVFGLIEQGLSVDINTIKL